MKINKEILKGLTIIISILCAVVLGLFHFSYTVLMGISEEGWKFIWGFTIDIMFLSLSIYGILEYKGFVKRILMFVWAPYFVVLSVYQFITYSGLWKFDDKFKEHWNAIWCSILIILLIGGISYFILKGYDKD